MQDVIEELEDLRRLMLAEEQLWHQALAQVHTAHAYGARNLLHYMVLRREDRGTLEARLNTAGLSLDTDPSHLLHRIDCYCSLLRGEALRQVVSEGDAVASLEQCTVDLLGPAPAMRRTRIMVTLGPESGADYGAVRKLIAAGVDCVRINCARDGRDVWSAIIEQVRHAEREVGRHCAVFLDIAGAKLRVLEVRVPGKEHKPLTVKRGDLFALCPASTIQYVKTTLPLLFVSGGKALNNVKVGDAVWFDDGKVGGKITAKEAEALTVVVTHVKKGGATLRPERSVNLPDSELVLPLLTSKDEDDLRFARGRADMVGLSFVRSPETIRRAAEIMGTDDETGVVVKVENLTAVEKLPLLLLEAMKRRRAGVLLARGDLAVECGYERLAALQDEIVAFCEAAALPLFWATEVLDSYVRKSRMTRPEMTDVASAARAECVMLNRGDELLPGIALLDRLLQRHNTYNCKGHSRLARSPLAMQSRES